MRNSVKKSLLALRFQNLATIVVIGIFSMALMSLSTHKVNAAQKGEAIFSAYCAACHAHGKNIVDPKKPLIGSQQLKTKEIFKVYILKGNGSMPSFPQIANDDQTLQALYNYCKTMK